MRKHCLLLLTSICLILFAVASMAQEPLNLKFAKQTVVRYYNSGDYSYDISKALEPAKSYLGKRIAANNSVKHKQKLAIVLDIDETAISNYNFMKNHDFAATPTLIAQQTQDTNSPATPQILQLYNYAKQHNVAIFFLTGRGTNHYNSTVTELHNAGYKSWNKLYLCNTTTIHCGNKNFKPETRAKIISKGYDIVLNVGDQYSDLNDGYADYVVKLPNPFYFIP